MKHLLILALAAVALVACQKDNKGKLDPDAMVSIRPATGVKAEGDVNPAHLSALEIVKQCESIRFYSPGYGIYTGAGFGDRLRDTVNLRLMMWGSDIIAMTGKLDPTFIDAVDVVFVRFDRTADAIKDTVAYIPNRTLREAAIIIREAYAAEDYTRCYALFDQAYTFIPITGAEWRELKARGEN